MYVNLADFLKIEFRSSVFTVVLINAVGKKLLSITHRSKLVQ
jgi:hypothetical protein